jgi:hypothetical protein
MVGKAIAGKLVELGHEVRMGSRTSDNASARDWAAKVGDQATTGTFAQAALFGDVVFNCTSGQASLAVIDSAGLDALSGKVLVDVANPLDFSAGFPPSLSVSNTDSLGEQLQRALPDTQVVKTLNTVNAHVMVDPAALPGRHDVFLAGDDTEAKSVVRGLLESFGWPPDDIVDLGGIVAARATEMYLPLWLALMSAVGSPQFNVHIVRGTEPSG